MIGKIRRLNRLFNSQSHNTILVPLDHGISMGPIKGIEDMSTTLKVLYKNGVNAVVLNKGMITSHFELLKDSKVSLIMHLSASTSLGSNPDYKILTGTLFEAISLGCDAVSVHINIGCEYETEMLRDVASVASECYKFGMPLLVMVYLHRKLKSHNDFGVSDMKHAARIAAEVGADIIKIAYPGHPNILSEIVNSCPVPIVIAGGEKFSEEDKLYAMVEEAIMAGARGISIGRNIFQHLDIGATMKNIISIVHEKNGVLEPGYLVNPSQVAMRNIL